MSVDAGLDRVLDGLGLRDAVMASLLGTQAFHTVEHVIQGIQYHVLLRPAPQSSGIFPPADAEWVHLAFNLWVMAACACLVVACLRTRAGWSLLALTGWHVAEHAYIVWQYHRLGSEIALLGVTGISAEGVPGILGRDGWLSGTELGRAVLRPHAGPLVELGRIDLHLFYNSLEMALLALVAREWLRIRNLRANGC